MEIEEVWVTITSYNIIGIITQYVPVKEIWKDLNHINIILSNSGYAVVEPMDYVVELIKKYESSPADNKAN